MNEASPPPKALARRSFLETLEIDSRLLGMVAAFVVICLAFQLWTGIRAMNAFSWNSFAWLANGRFLIPQNVFNITIQSVSVAIMATGMVFVIVTRHIDLSVGAILALCSAVMGVLQVTILPKVLGLGIAHPAIAPVAMMAGLATGAGLGAFTGWLVGYQRIPSFIVTLGGLLIWRNLGWYMTDGQTQGPLDATFILFGGAEGTLGPSLSWVVGLVACALIVLAMMQGRKGKVRHGFAVKPLWAEGVLAGLACALVLGLVAVLNAYQIPAPRLKRMFEAKGEVMPEGYSIGFGLPISVLILVVVAIAMTVVAKRTRFGRYIFATGGNPDAAELSGINTRALTVKVFALMGFLCGLSAIIAQARLQNHTNDIGTLDELRVIAAAVIGGTALAGGIGTIHGALLGALIMQALASGMAMVGVDSPLQNIVVGLVLVMAVWIDIQYRKRRGIR
ncbi:sugar ABC transporter permease [Xinfangfangia sp. CPCC 101601]|uniref:Xylose transport system permease protein XylH n=1 Tax=Pseudogemmobacter lacusdianii TaxID=3069608 RepID=A0ABU0VU43_9RHOB|nr:sugar ABC transporter permease [Xinfangfangia sp. CPCC 101601]MDQ2065249.1 sugar ABC transporter permease [Xinfangfangia sp. CPCC 101601]